MDLDYGYLSDSSMDAEIVKEFSIKNSGINPGLGNVSSGSGPELSSNKMDSILNVPQKKSLPTFPTYSTEAVKNPNRRSYPLLFSEEATQRETFILTKNPSSDELTRKTYSSGKLNIPTSLVRSPTLNEETRQADNSPTRNSPRGSR